MDHLHQETTIVQLNNDYFSCPQFANIHLGPALTTVLKNKTRALSPKINGMESISKK